MRRDGELECISGRAKRSCGDAVKKSSFVKPNGRLVSRRMRKFKMDAPGKAD